MSGTPSTAGRPFLLPASVGVCVFGSGCEGLSVGGIVGTAIGIAPVAVVAVVAVILVRVHRSVEQARHRRFQRLAARMGALPVEAQEDLMDRFDLYTHDKSSGRSGRALAWEEFVTRVVTEAEKQVHREGMQELDRRMEALPDEVREWVRQRISDDESRTIEIRDPARRASARLVFAGAVVAAGEASVHLPDRAETLAVRLAALSPESAKAVFVEIGRFSVKTLCEIPDPEERCAAWATRQDELLTEAEARTAPGVSG